MLKKVIIFLLVGVLSLTLIPAYALGNDWNFSSLWWASSITNAYTVTTSEFGTSKEGKVVNLFPDEKIRDGVLMVDDVVYKSPFDNTSDNALTYFKLYSNETVPRLDENGELDIDYVYYTYDTSFPVNLWVPANGTLNFQFLQTFGSNATVRLNCNNGSSYFLSSSNGSLTRTVFDDAKIGAFVVDGNGTVTEWETYVSSGEGEFTMYECSWTNPTDEKLLVGSISIYVQSKGANAYIGFFVDNSNVVTLPSYVEENLENISYEIERLGTTARQQLQYLSFINTKLTDIKELIGNDTGVAAQYYQTIIQPSQEQVVKQEELAQKVEEAKEQLAEIQSILEKEPTVSYDDIQSVTSQADITVDEALNNEDTKKFFELMFNNSLISTMLVAVIALATVGYVLFGKKG